MHIPLCWELFKDMLGRAIADLFCFGAKSRGVGLFVCFKAYSQLNSNSQLQEVVIHYIFKESVNLHILVFKYISFTK